MPLLFRNEDKTNKRRWDKHKTKPKIYNKKNTHSVQAKKRGKKAKATNHQQCNEHYALCGTHSYIRNLETIEVMCGALSL